jgi:hypothetical protein
MSIEIIRIRRCDSCSLLRKEGEESTILEGGDLPFLVDLGLGQRHLDICDQCNDALTWKQFQDLYVKEGRALASRQPRRGRIPGTSGLSTVGTPTTADGGDDESAEKQGGQPCPLCEKRFATYAAARNHLVKTHGCDPEDFPTKCALCDTSNAHITTIGGVRMHTTRMHGLGHLASILRAKKTGDPQKVWTQVEAMQRGRSGSRSGKASASESETA